MAPFFVDATGIAKFLKSVVAHEVGHQWWGSRVSNANDRNYWFVESLAEYSSALCLEAVRSGLFAKPGTPPAQQPRLCVPVKDDRRGHSDYDQDDRKALHVRRMLRAAAT